MNENEKNINEETLEKVSGGIPIGNHTYVDENGVEHKEPSPTVGIHFNGKSSSI